MQHRQDTATLLRRINAIAAAVVGAFFLIHAIMGALSAASIIHATPPIALLWAAAALAVIHAILSIATSVFMVTDKLRPPSTRKKQHLALKWITGFILLFFGYAHITHLTLPGIAHWLLSIALVVSLTWHGWVGAKSLSRDLGISNRTRTPLRIVLCIVAALVTVIISAHRFA